jgi:hypothetical protein
MAYLATAGAVSAGVGLLGGAATMAFGKDTKIKTPPPVDIGKAINDYTTGYGQGLPSVVSLEGQYRPQFGQLNLADIAQYQQGLQNIQGLGMSQTQQQLNSGIGANLSGMGGNLDAAQGLLGSMNPQGQMLMQQQVQAAQQAYGNAQGLTGQEGRMSDQAARQAALAHGTIDNNASLANEAMSRDSFLIHKKQEAAAFGQQAYNTTQNYYAPLQGLLSAAPEAYNRSQQFTSAASNMLGQSKDQLINPDTGINIASAYNQNLFGQNAAQAQINASSNAANMKFFGDMIGSGATMAKK